MAHRSGAGVLGGLRMLPEIAAHILHGERPSAPERMTLHDIAKTPLGEGGWALLGELSGVMRTANTDPIARRWFRRYWTFGVGSGAHILVNGLLDLVREDAEAQARS